MIRGKGSRLGALAGLVALSAVSVAGEPARAAAASEQACGGSDAIDPISLYGDEIRFDVRRNGSLVGSHRVSFARQGEQTTATTRFEVEVDVLFFTAYRYVYASQATWQGGCLAGLTATTDDNGNKSVVRIERDGRKLSIVGPDGKVEAERTTLPTEHWDYRVVDRDAVINTITGRLNSVNITPMGAETVVLAADGRLLTARHYVYSGELDNEVWYDGQGRWVKMRFPAKDGSTIEYICVKCGAGRIASRS